MYRYSMLFPVGRLALLVALFLVARSNWGAEPGIYLMKSDGTHQRRVIAVPGYTSYGSPRWSHDGKRLAFDAAPAASEVKKFFVVAVDGSELVNLGTGDFPDWSPDDKQIVSWSHGEDAKFGVWVQGVDGMALEWLAEGGSARWSHDGTRIVYAWRHILRNSDLVSGEVRILLEEGFEENLVAFDWSPDDKRIAFVNRRKGAIARKLFLVSTVDPQPKATVVPIPAGKLGSHLSWTPDGKSLAITLNGAMHLVDLSQPQQPLKLPGQKEPGSDPSFSPDGEWIAFVRGE